MFERKWMTVTLYLTFRDSIFDLVHLDLTEALDLQ